MSLILAAGFLLAAVLVSAAVVLHRRDRRGGEAWPDFLEYLHHPPAHAFRVRPNVLRALRHEPGLAVFDAVCACGWQSRAYQTEAAAQLEAEQHQFTAERAMS